MTAERGRKEMFTQLVAYSAQYAAQLKRRYVLAHVDYCFSDAGEHIGGQVIKSRLTEDGISGLITILFDLRHLLTSDALSLLDWYILFHGPDYWQYLRDTGGYDPLKTVRSYFYPLVRPWFNAQVRFAARRLFQTESINSISAIHSSDIKGGKDGASDTTRT
ncbi:MAG: hypothetical protein EOO38_06265 [Cytophagaceae bacterium]|nr:MAG: hypothetical protein EOO38_06265 [Cytophagaceae bacterium]